MQQHPLFIDVLLNFNLWCDQKIPPRQMNLWCNKWFVGQVSELRGEVSRLEAEKEKLERELDTQTNHTHKQV